MEGRCTLCVRVVDGAEVLHLGEEASSAAGQVQAHDADQLLGAHLPCTKQFQTICSTLVLRIKRMGKRVEYHTGQDPTPHAYRKA
jgi:hypothetical protein